MQLFTIVTTNRINRSTKKFNIIIIMTANNTPFISSNSILRSILFIDFTIFQPKLFNGVSHCLFSFFIYTHIH